jgi:hypothetical protein
MRWSNRLAIDLIAVRHHKMTGPSAGHFLFASLLALRGVERDPATRQPGYREANLSAFTGVLEIEDIARARAPTGCGQAIWTMHPGPHSIEN